MPRLGMIDLNRWVRSLSESVTRNVASIPIPWIPIVTASSSPPHKTSSSETT